MSRVGDEFDAMGWGPAPESAVEANAWLTKYDRRFGHFIAGSIEAPGADLFATTNPALGEQVAMVTQGTTDDIDRAVRAARSAQQEWQGLGGHGRARYLYALARQLQKQSRLFAVLETLDNGKPIREARDIDIPLAVRHFYHHAGWADMMAEAMPGYQPVGVVGQIVPWNFPLLMLAWKIAPALAMGNTVVLKPAEFTPLTGLLFGEICRIVGLPAGVVNIVTGDGRTGDALVRHPDVDKIAFTGSTEVGRAIRVATAGTGKKLSLELGGKSPFIVFDDADLDSAVEGVVDAIWFNQGQVCCAGSRILAQEPIADRLVSKLRARMETLRVGSPLDKAIDIGAIVAPVQLDRIRSLVDQGEREGATRWQPSWSCPAEGLFYPPTLFTDVAPASTIAQVEIFGPVVVMMTFRTPAEAVELANNTRYGLAASIWTENINTALDIAPQIKAGTIWVNCTNLFDAASGFGGYRESGFGREGGIEGLWGYVKPEPSRAARPKVRARAARPRAAVRDRPPVDRTYKLYIGGKQVRPDSGYTLPVRSPDGRALAEVGHGNRKDIRNAVEAARSAQAGWARLSGHQRAQILYYLGENLDQRRTEFARNLMQATGASAGQADLELEVALRRVFRAAAWADKYDGRVHGTPSRSITIAMVEPVGVLGVVAPETPTLAGFLSLVLPAIAMGNAVVALPSEGSPLAALECYQLFDTSDLPGGVVNLVTGLRSELVPVLAGHDNVDGIWYAGSPELAEEVERLSAGNLKRTWVDRMAGRDWLALDPPTDELLREATQVKNIWVPYGA
ncbi:MAG: aldehyde dehydrogenase family protein [Gemmatimonadales bacterium]